MGTGSAPDEILLGLLKQAAAAHGVHEQEDLGGVYDEAWPEWYAAHLARGLAELGYRMVPAAAVATVDASERNGHEPV